MIDWSLVAKIVGGGFGMVVLILVTLALVIWGTELLERRVVKSKQNSNIEQGKTEESHRES